MKIKSIGVVMDAIDAISYKKDSTLAMLWEATKRGWHIFYFEQQDLFIENGIAYGKSKQLNVFHDEKKWFELDSEKIIELSQLNVLLMRKDPPFNREYIYTSYILELAERQGVFVANKPQALRDANEKMFTTWFPQCCAASLVTRDIALLKRFYQQHHDIVCKPLDAMGGAGIFHLKPGDVNANVVFETLTQNGTQTIMAQKFIPEIIQGDKRILMINGNPIPYSLARIPAPNEWRGNLAAGAQGIAKPLTMRDKWICEQVGPTLRDKGLYFVGLDVIGDFLTEINVTSPTCIREIDEQCGTNIASIWFDCIEQKLAAR
jgi:glutathione synthase